MGRAQKAPALRTGAATPTISSGTLFSVPAVF
jgi:hypothetical protein